MLRVDRRNLPGELTRTERTLAAASGFHVYNVGNRGLMSFEPAFPKSAQSCESVTAVAVLRAGSSLEIDELQGWATARLARYKLPTRLEIIKALPRKPAGKVLKSYFANASSVRMIEDQVR